MLGPGQTQAARMWVYVGDEAHPYSVFDFTLNRGREGPKEFLKDYTQILLADAYGGYNGVVAGNAITRAGCWSHARRRSLAGQAVCGGKTGQGGFRGRETGDAAGAVGACAGGAAAEVADMEGTVAAEASHGRSGELRSQPMGGADCVHDRWRSAHR